MKYVLCLREVGLGDLGHVGGKAARLGALAQAGFPVPPGFCITTQAFEESGFASSADDVLLGEPDLEKRAERILSRFESRALPADLLAEITAAYEALGASAVAVRSSATGEDTSLFSFAGQYESFLQVVGMEQLSLAVRRCWASWWSPRAARYNRRLPARASPSPSSSSGSMAVLVQSMVPARSSGVLFTVNPVTSSPDEIVINAGPGLGEAIVSGLVTPDTYRLDRQTLRVRERVLGSKENMVVAGLDGTRLASVPRRERRRFSLTRAQCSALGRLGIGIESLFGSAQDVEYVHDGRDFWIVQTRPVTGCTSWPKPEKGIVWSRHSILEFMPQPLSPLFETTYLPVLDAFGREICEEWGITVKGREPLTTTLNGYAFIRIDFKNVSCWHILKTVPTSLRFLGNLWRDRWRRTLLRPYGKVVSHWQDVDVEKAPWDTLWEGVLEICGASADYWRACIQNRISGPIERVFSWFYRVFVERTDRPSVSVFLRAYESEPVRAERELFRSVAELRGDVEIESALATTRTGELPARLEDSEQGRGFLSSLRGYLHRCGHQFFNLDFREPTLGERPEQLVEAIKSFLAQPEGTRHRSEELRLERERAESQLRTDLDPVRWTLLRGMVKVLEYSLVLREDVVFFLGLGWPTLRRFILELGRRLAESGALENDEDVFFLTQTELREMSARASARNKVDDLRTKIRERRERWDEQVSLKPPALIPSDFRIWGVRMSAFLPEAGQTYVGRQIAGIAVSSGKATGPAVVIDSPGNFHRMKPGCVLVVPMTTPAWTPLFASAAAVVTDVGGLLSHTSIVAREYGIPAVIGTGVATRCIVDGQLITVDGDRGTVVLHVR